MTSKIEDIRRPYNKAHSCIGNNASALHLNYVRQFYFPWSIGDTLSRFISTVQPWLRDELRKAKI